LNNKTWISEYVDKIFLINLEHRKDRLKESIHELDRVGIVNDMTIFPAVEHSLGIIGCTLSHYELVKHAKNKGYKNILIFEDDIEFHDDVSIFKNTIQSAFDTIKEKKLDPHMLYLGGNATHTHPGHDNTIPYHEQVSDHLYQLGGCKTTHAYIIFESMYDTIIETYDKIKWTPEEFRGDKRMNIDFWYLSRIHHSRSEYNVYGVYPALAGQRESHSDIMERVMYFNLFEKYNKLLETNGIG
jgi:GR25 family glycosyltransferase involved in LPS biosynthesis